MQSAPAPQPWTLYSHNNPCLRLIPVQNSHVRNTSAETRQKEKKKEEITCSRVGLVRARVPTRQRAARRTHLTVAAAAAAAAAAGSSRGAPIMMCREISICYS